MEERIRFELPTTVDITFDAEDVAVRLKPSQVLELIKELDMEVGLQDFTVLLYRYFADQMEAMKKSDPDVDNPTDDVLLLSIDGLLEDEEDPVNGGV